MLEGLAVAGVQGVSEENDRFAQEVREEARETVTRMRMSVGPAQDSSVTFRCSLAVVGPPKSGKTSLLHALAKGIHFEEGREEREERERREREVVGKKCCSSNI